MKRVKLTKNEKQIEDALVEGKYVDLDKFEFKSIAKAVSSRKKDSVISLRINSEDLKLIKKKAKDFGIKYQTFISELLHRIAHN